MTGQVVLAAGTPGVPAATSRDDPAHPDAGYRERSRLVAHLAAVYEAHWAEPNPADPHATGFRVACVHSPEGQMCWHVHPDDEALFPCLPTRPSDFDGHTTAEKHARLAAMVRRAAAGRDAATRDYTLRMLGEARGDLGRADSRAIGFLGVAATAAAVMLAALLAGDWSPAVLPAGCRVLWWAGVAAGLTGVGLLAAAANPGRAETDGEGRVAYYGHVPALAARGHDALVTALDASAQDEVGVLAAELASVARLAVANQRLIRAGLALLACADACLGSAALLGVAL